MTLTKPIEGRQNNGELEIHARDTFNTPRFPAILDYNGLEQDIVGRSTLEQILM